MTRRAEYWKTEDGTIRCVLCPQRCRIEPGEVGTCRVRGNEDGALIARSWGLVAALHLDPIEKKPLYHFHPGSEILSAGAVGCNFRCAFCQNWQLVEGPIRGDVVEPDALLAAVRRSGGVGLAYTYNEPLIWFEYVKDTAPLLRAGGFKTVLVSNGFVEEAPLDELLPLVDAWNIDLKAIDAEFYRRLCGGRIKPVMRTITRAAAVSHVEVTNLLVPGENDAPDQVRRLAEWIASVRPNVPLHLSRYFPNREFDRPPTPTEVMLRSREIARESLHHVFLGNMATRTESNTYCPSCSALLIERSGYRTRIVGMSGSACAACGAETGVIV